MQKIYTFLLLIHISNKQTNFNKCFKYSSENKEQVYY